MTKMMQEFDKLSDWIIVKAFPFLIFILGGGIFAWFTILIGKSGGISNYFIIPISCAFILIFAMIGRVAYKEMEKQTK